MNAVDGVIRWSTALTAFGVGAVAAIASYEHTSSLVRAHGESGWTGRLILLTVDALIYASSMVMIIRGAQMPAVARCLDDVASVIDPLGEQAAVVFAAELTADRVPSVHDSLPQPSGAPERACKAAVVRAP